VATSVGVVTALVPIIGYEAAAKLAKRGLATGESIAGMVVERGLMSRADVEAELTPARLAREVPPDGLP